jgi:hypothetical protein
MVFLCDQGCRVNIEEFDLGTTQQLELVLIIRRVRHKSAKVCCKSNIRVAKIEMATMSALPERPPSFLRSQVGARNNGCSFVMKDVKGKEEE